MANAQTLITLDALHEAILAAIRQKFPQLATVVAYRQGRGSLPVPACLVELVEQEATDELDPGTGRLALQAR